MYNNFEISLVVNITTNCQQALLNNKTPLSIQNQLV